MNSINEQMLGCAVILFNEKNEILLGKRKNAFKAGYYGLPGGHLEVGEPLVKCIEREVLEETGVTELSYSFVTTVREWQGAADFVHFIFCAPLQQEKVPTMEPEKCEGWEWFSVDTLPENIIVGHLEGIRAWSETHVPVVDRPQPQTSSMYA